MKNFLDSLREHTIVVADTGDIEAIRTVQPTDATTNPSLVLKIAQDPRFQSLIAHYNKGQYPLENVVVGLGYEILQLIPGRISTEVDAALSYDTAATIQVARRIHQAYQALGISTERILIKIAATWEGIQAAKVLEEEGIHCNLTLMFSLAQAIEAAHAGVTLISPFVGRVYDWYLKQHDPRCLPENYRGENDPGVRLVRDIYFYYKQHGYETEIMGASFRNVEQIVALAGCDLLTISPDLLSKLEQTSGTIRRALPEATAPSLPPYNGGKEAFDAALKADRMAIEKLQEGIDAFIRDGQTLAQHLSLLG